MRACRKKIRAEHAEDLEKMAENANRNILIFLTSFFENAAFVCKTGGTVEVTHTSIVNIKSNHMYDRTGMTS